MPTPLPPVRRIVTGNDASGRSRIVEDGESPAVITMEARPGYRNSNLWRTLGADASVDAADSITQHKGVLPPKGGTVLRVIDIPPESKDPEERRKQTVAIFAAMFPDATRHEHDQHRHPGMHITDTVDYAILLQGELVAIMDEGETVMRAGDVLIQRGTNHAWANRSDTIARIAFILIDAGR
jgi:quercetin dioxygenase-like cupin family protein